MKINLKNLSNKLFTVEIISSDQTVLELKECLSKETGEDTKVMKFVFNGTILDDNKQLKEYNIVDNSLVIWANIRVNVKKPVEESKKEESKKEEEVPKKTVVKPTNSNNMPSSPKLTSNTSNNPNTNPNTIPPEELIKLTKELADMGFSGQSAKEAIIAARGNLVLAIDVLTGVLSLNQLNQNQDYQGNQGNFNEDNQYSDDGQEQEGGEGDDIIDQGEPDEGYADTEENLRNIASIAKIICKNDIAKLNDVLESLVIRFPSVVQIIESNYEEFLEMFQEPTTNEDTQIYNEYLKYEKENNGGQGIIGGGDNGGNSNNTENTNTNVNPQQVLQVDFTDKEKEEIKALVVLVGCSEKEAVEAYITCDKNEELAANYLFDNASGSGNANYGGLYIDCKYFNINF